MHNLPHVKLNFTIKHILVYRIHSFLPSLSPSYQYEQISAIKSERRTNITESYDRSSYSECTVTLTYTHQNHLQQAKKFPQPQYLITKCETLRLSKGKLMFSRTSRPCAQTPWFHPPGVPGSSYP